MRNHAQLWLIDQLINNWSLLKLRQVKLNFRNTLHSLVRGESKGGSNLLEDLKKLSPKKDMGEDQLLKEALTRVDAKVFKLQVMATIEAWEDVEQRDRLKILEKWRQ